MVKNYIITAGRYIIREKKYAIINIFGMGLGIACCILILLFIKNELTYDTFHKNAEHLYRVYYHSKSASRVSNSRFTPPPLAGALKDEFTTIKNITRIGVPRTRWLISNEQSLKADVVPVDASFFNMFSFSLEKTENNQVLQNINEVIISQEIARKFFNETNPTGKIIKIHNLGDFVIAGILAETPTNSSYSFDVLIHINYIGQGNLESWGASCVQTFVQLMEHAEPVELENQFKYFILKYFPERLFKNTENSLHLQQLTDVYLNRKNIQGLAPAGNITYIYILSCIALLIALIACINFMNLSIANSMGRITEIRMRRLLGATKLQIICQFLGEAFIYSMLAFIIGMLLGELFLPVFNQLVNKELNMEYSIQPINLAGVLGLLLFFTLLSGAYPAFFMTRFHALPLVKSNIGVGKQGILFPKTLVIVQFFLSIVLIIAMVVMRTQLEFLKTEHLGFNRQQVVALPYPESKHPLALETIKTELQEHANIVNVSGCLTHPGSHGHWGTQINIPGINNNEPFNVIFETIDESFIPTLEIPIKEGRNFSRDFSTDIQTGVIVNETFIKETGLQSPLGKEIVLSWRNFKKGTIIGVVQDIHLKPLLYEMEPIVFNMKPIFGLSYILVKIKAENMKETLNFLEKKWQEFSPDEPYEFHFIDDEYEKAYFQEHRWSRIVKTASILALTISGLGLFALTSLIVIRRTKEIGIRKVLGASVFNIFTFLNKEFIILILIANLIALPVDYIILNRWLQNYPYHIEMNIILFLLPGLITLVIALLTVSYQAVRAATANPVEALRYE